MNEFTPFPKQSEFITSNKKFVCYSGGFGAGKTLAGCIRGMLLSQMPNNRGLIGRLTYPELINTTQKTFFEWCPPEWYDKEHGGEYRRSERLVKFANGSEVMFMHLDTVSEKELLSLNLGWFFIDQAEEIGEKVFSTLISRLRLNTVSNRYGFIVCNPEPGNWIYKQFKEPKDKGTLLEDHAMIETSTRDNPHLPPDYVPTLIQKYPKELQDRYIEGKWNFFEGQIYTSFNTNTHVIKPFKIPNGWEKLIGIDYGMVNPTAALWAAIDYDNNIFIYDEYYASGVVSVHANAILQKTGKDDISYWLIDPSTEARTKVKDGMVWSVLQEFEDYGVFATPANNELLGGINRVKEFLKVEPKRRHPQTGIFGSPRLFIFSHCINLIGEFPQYQWKRMRGLQERNAPERPRDLNDHALDALRYIIMSRFPPPQRKPFGDELITPLQRKNANDFTQGYPDGYKGDSMLGIYEDGLGVSI